MIEKRGQLRSWHAENGFGIIVVSRQERYFLHITNVKNESPEPFAGAECIFYVDLNESVAEKRLPAALKTTILENFGTSKPIAPKPKPLAHAWCKPGDEGKINAIKKGTAIYFAGKISRNDWRHYAVSGGEWGSALRDASSRNNAWKDIVSLGMSDGNLYVGPFFMSCDHGCYHGENTHGATSSDPGCNGENRPSERDVFQKAFQGIQNCDVFFVWMGEDFHEAYGTLVEIGIAKTLKKTIILAKHPKAKNDFWFAEQCATGIFFAEDPVIAYQSYAQNKIGVNLSSLSESEKGESR